MFCKKCGNEIPDNSKFCVKCGTTINSNQPTPQVAEDKTSVGLIILSILFPIVGIVLGIVNLRSKKSSSGKVYLIVGIICAIVWMSINSAMMTPTTLEYTYY